MIVPRLAAEHLLALVSLVGLLAVAALAHGCGLSCTQAGCLSGVGIDVRGDDGLPVGAFEVTYRVDDGPSLALCCSGRSPYRCDGTTTPECADAGFVIRGEPARITLTITTTSGATYDGTLEPQFGAPYRPNGPYCDPVCRGASELVELQ